MVLRDLTTLLFVYFSVSSIEPVVASIHGVTTEPTPSVLSFLDEPQRVPGEYGSHAEKKKRLTITDAPSSPPSKVPTSSPSRAFKLTDKNNNRNDDPLHPPSETPSSERSILPTTAPTNDPTYFPTAARTASPIPPTDIPTADPTRKPSQQPTPRPTNKPTKKPTHNPTARPSRRPSAHPSWSPTAFPSVNPTTIPTKIPSVSPSNVPSSKPTSIVKGTADFLQFSVHLLCVSPIDGDVVAEVLETYLQQGMTFPNLKIVMLFYTTAGRRAATLKNLATDQVFVLDGTAYFDGNPPEGKEFHFEQTELLSDYGAVEGALRAHPNIPDSVILLSVDMEDGTVIGSIKANENPAHNGTTTSGEHSSGFIIGATVSAVCLLGVVVLLYARSLHIKRKENDSSNQNRISGHDESISTFSSAGLGQCKVNILQHDERCFASNSPMATQ